MTTASITQLVKSYFERPLVHSPRFTVHSEVKKSLFSDVQVQAKPKGKKRSKLNRYANTIAIENIKEDVEAYNIRARNVYYYQTSKGHWRIHLHGYGRDEEGKMFLYETERMFGYDLLNCTTQVYAGKLAKRLAEDINARYLGHNKSFKGAK
jgi:hypothetical protein